MRALAIMAQQLMSTAVPRDDPTVFAHPPEPHAPAQAARPRGARDGRARAAALQPIRAKLKAAAYSHGGVDWEKFFRQYDKSGDGALDLAEFRAALDVMHVQLPAEKLRHVFEFFDADGDMQLDAIERMQNCD